jgi:hypothetical protein
VHVVDRLEDVTFRPDIIHGHHQVETMLALVHFRCVPAIFVCHDRLSWHDSPPMLNAVRRYVAVDWNCQERLVIEAGIPKERTRVIPNAVDLRRFEPRQPLPAKPAKALARTLSGELISRGIRVNAVSPGPISTPLYDKLGLAEADLKAVAASIQGQVPAGRFGNPLEIAQAVVFLASDGAAFTVGSELLIDGGMSNL